MDSRVLTDTLYQDSVVSTKITYLWASCITLKSGGLLTKLLPILLVSCHILSVVLGWYSVFWVFVSSRFSWVDLSFFPYPIHLPRFSSLSYRVLHFNWCHFWLHLIGHNPWFTTIYQCWKEDCFEYFYFCVLTNFSFTVEHGL